MEKVEFVATKLPENFLQTKIPPPCSSVWLLSTVERVMMNLGVSGP